MITSSKVSQIVRNTLGLTNASELPDRVSKIIVPTIETNPVLVQSCDTVFSGQVTNSTTVTVTTLPTDKQFYLCQASVSYAKDAVNTSVETYLNVTVNGKTVQLLALPNTSLTNQNGSISATFPKPIPLDKGSTIQAICSNGTAFIKIYGTAVGYFDETRGI